MEENYKEFIAKIKYMVEYDTSKTRDENHLIVEDANTNLEIKSISKKLYMLFKKEGAKPRLTTDKNIVGAKEEENVSIYMGDGPWPVQIDIKAAGPTRGGVSLEDAKKYRETIIRTFPNLEASEVQDGGKDWDGNPSIWFQLRAKQSRLGQPTMTEGVITEQDTPKEKGIEEAQKIVNKIRAKHKNDKNWDDFIDGFVERINDAFGE